MAAAIATATVTASRAGDGWYRVFGTIAITASPATYTTGGVPFSMMQSDIKAQRAPLWVNAKGISGYTFSYVAGTDNSNGLLKVFVPKVTGAAADDAMIELTSALAIPAGLSGDTISFEAVWKGML